jgi:hypothetical protein
VELVLERLSVEGEKLMLECPVNIVWGAIGGDA